MRIIRYLAGDGPATGIALQDGRILDVTRHLPDLDDMAVALSPAGIASLGAFEAAAKAETRAREDLRMDEVTVLPPLSPTSRIFCIGINYKSHAAETGRDMPPQPSVFTRTRESVVGHGQAIRRPVASGHFDFEGELAVMVGRSARNLSEADALAVIAGYTCFNDGSIRDFQKHSVTAGKNFDSSGACGPWVVTADEIPDHTALLLTTRLNGAEVQRSGTDLLIYSIPRILSYLSKITELRPGDVVATGTPAGVGARRDPPLWMKPGDAVEVEIDGIGILHNPVAAADAAAGTVQ